MPRKDVLQVRGVVCVQGYVQHREDVTILV